MKKIIYIFITTFLCFNCYSQIIFEKGYYIDNSGQKVECLIKNVDWKLNPTEILYKQTENSEQLNMSISAIKEFAINNVSKYIKFKVNIDKSSSNIKNLSTVKDPTYTNEELFLKVLVEGKGDLFLYEEIGIVRYFYKMENTDIQQLVYKSYVNEDRQFLENNGFRQQLWNDLKCPEITNDAIKNINYEKKPLVKLFVKYNECNKSEFVNFEQKEKKDLFNINIRPGINSASLSIQNSVLTSAAKKTDFNNEISFRLGIEAEFIFPFNKNKWAILIEPTYQYYKSEAKQGTKTVEADYKSIELPIGIRHYFFLNNNSKIFINGSYVFDFARSSKIVLANSNELDVVSRANIAFGIGYNYNKKYSVELRYATSREIISDYVYWSSDYKCVSLIFGYTIL